MKTKFLFFLVVFLLSAMALIVPSGLAYQVTPSQEPDNKMGLEAKAVEADSITVGEYLLFLRANKAIVNKDELYSDALESQIVRTSEEGQDDYVIAEGVNDDDLMLDLTSAEAAAYFKWKGISVEAKASPLMMFGGDIEESEKKSEPNVGSHGEDSRLTQPRTETSVATASRATTPVSLKEANDGANSVLEKRSPVGQVIHQQTPSDIISAQKELRGSPSSSIVIGERVNQETTNLLEQIRSCQTKVALDRNHGMEIPTALSSSSGSVFKSTAAIGMLSSEHDLKGDFFGASLTAEKKDDAMTGLLAEKKSSRPTTPFKKDSLSDLSNPQISRAVEQASSEQITRAKEDEGATTPEGSDSSHSTPEKNPDGSKDAQTVTQHVKTAVISATGFSDAAHEININRALSAAASAESAYKQLISHQHTIQNIKSSIWVENYPIMRSAIQEALVTAQNIPSDAPGSLEVTQTVIEGVINVAKIAVLIQRDPSSFSKIKDIAEVYRNAVASVDDAAEVLKVAQPKIGKALVEAQFKRIDRAVTVASNNMHKIRDEAWAFYNKKTSLSDQEWDYSPINRAFLDNQARLKVLRSISAARNAFIEISQETKTFIQSNSSLSKEELNSSPIVQRFLDAQANCEELRDLHEIAKYTVLIRDNNAAKKAAITYSLEIAQETMNIINNLVERLSLTE